MPALARVFPLAALIVTAACDDSSPVAPPALLPPLQTAVWHVQTSDGQAVPALLGHRTLPGNVLEQDFLDSARVEINADGTWEHLGWYQRFRNQEHFAWGNTLDWGTWTATTSGYEFRRNTGALLYTINGPVGDELQLNLRYPGQEGVAVSLLRQARPAPTVMGRWLAEALGDQPLPATLYYEPAYPGEDGPVSRHIVIDSAVVFLYANNSYLQRIFHTEWEGPANSQERQRALGSFIEADFGTWTRTGLALTLQSGWIQNKTITGLAAADLVGPLVLNHGITHGDEPAAFRYTRQ